MKGWRELWAERPARVVIFLLLVVTGFRFFYCTHLDLTGDEAYYFLWSKHLDASYFSKGPAIAWTIAFGTKIMGETVFGVRWLSVLLSAGTGWQLFLLMRRLAGSEAALETVALAVIVPLLAMGATLMTIDPLSVFFWVWAMNLFWDVLDSRSLRAGALLGFAVGCGFLAKYINVLQLAGFIGFLLAVPRYRGWLRSRGAGAALVVFLFCTLPVIYWNAGHGWVTLGHLQHRAALDAGFRLRPAEFLGFLQGQALAMSPLLGLAIVVALLGTLWRREKTEAELFLLWMSGPVFLFYAVLGLNNSGEANWTAVGVVSVLGLAVMYWRRQAEGGGWRARVWAVAIALAAVQTGLLHETAPLHLPAGWDLLNRARGWRTLGSKMETPRSFYEGAILIGDTYQNASLLHFYCPDRPVVYLPREEHPEDQFGFWPQYQVTPQITALYITDRPGVPAALRRDFHQVDVVWDFDTTYGRRPVKHFIVYFCQP